MKLPRKRILVFLGVAVLASAFWLYLTHFYYNPGPFSIGVRNGTSDITLLNVSIRAEPRGEFGFGIVDHGQGKFYEDPHWPVPTNVFVSFSDPSRKTHTLATTGAPPEFRGTICVVITKSNDYALHLELESRQ